MMKALLVGSLLLLTVMVAAPTVSARPSPVDCNAVAPDPDGNGVPNYVAVGCNGPVRGCAWANLDGQMRYCTGKPR